MAPKDIDLPKISMAVQPLPPERFKTFMSFQLINENVRHNGSAKKIKEVMEKELKNHYHDVGGCSCIPRNGKKCTDESCYNRLNHYECNEDCSVKNGECQNRGITKQDRKSMQLVARGSWGIGVIACEVIEEGSFISEYCGVIYISRDNPHLGKSRYATELITNKNNELDSVIIEPTDKGNESRYLQHSHDPNCIAEVLKVGNELRVGMYAIKRIGIGQELTWNYGPNIRKLGIDLCNCSNLLLCPDAYKYLRSKCPDRDLSQPMQQAEENDGIANQLAPVACLSSQPPRESRADKRSRISGEHEPSKRQRMATCTSPSTSDSKPCTIGKRKKVSPPPTSVFKKPTEKRKSTRELSTTAPPSRNRSLRFKLRVPRERTRKIILKPPAPLRPRERTCKIILKPPSPPQPSKENTAIPQNRVVTPQPSTSGTARMEDEKKTDAAAVVSPLPSTSGSARKEDEKKTDAAAEPSKEDAEELHNVDYYLDLIRQRFAEARKKLQMKPEGRGRPKNPITVWHCYFCGAPMKRQNDYRVHLERAHLKPGKFPCPHQGCSKIFHTQKDLNDHVPRHLPLEKRIRYMCRDCRNYYTKWGDVVNHYKNPNNKCTPRRYKTMQGKKHIGYGNKVNEEEDTSEDSSDPDDNRK